MSATRSCLPRPSAFAVASIVFFVTAAPLQAHEFWSVPAEFQVAPGGALAVGGPTSRTFPTSEAAVGTGAAARATDSADVVAVIERYHKALAAGDSAAALALLASDAVILESGGGESREEYRGHHLPADISFARAVPSSRGKVNVVVRGDVAWASSTSVTQGKYKDRQINSAGAELMVLSREADGWKIRAIHWSSRTRRP